MWRSTVKIAVAISFLLLLTMPVSFYKSGPRDALWKAGMVAVLFTLATLGRRPLLTFFNIDPGPGGLNARILTGIAFASVFVLSGEAKEFFHNEFFDAILSAFRVSVVFGLLRPQYVGLVWFRPDLWHKSEYRHAVIMLGVVSMGLVFMYWVTLHWWALIVAPGAFLGYELGEWIGSSVRRWVLALREVWEIVRRMGPPIGGFALGYLIIAFIFAGLFASVWRADSRAFTGLPEHPALTDFIYYSVMTISTTGYGDVAPHSPPAKILASAEALVGLAWTIVVFAAVLRVVQGGLQPRQGGTDEHGKIAQKQAAGSDI